MTILPQGIDQENVENALGILQEYIDTSPGIDTCSRCEMPHLHLEWRLLSSILVIGNTVILGFTMCPTNDEPILFYMTGVTE